MNPKLNSERVKEIFENAIDFPSSEERRGYVKGVCNGDADLQARVQTLLRVHFENGESFLPESPRQLPITTSLSGEIEGKPGTVIGRYKLLQKIGEGGCGVVWMAEQEQPVRRRVALKVIKLGMDTKSVIARFEAERQALAMMDHPNIAKVLDAGSTDTGRPYFVMELVRGVRITAYCDENNLSTRERLDLFIKVCQAIQHAHQKGVIHRDIKPSNILVTINDDVPVPKVIDFGIAKATEQRLTDKTLFTEFQAFIGTPAYMSPEQAVMTSLDIDTRSDIYALGVLLYELLTGRTPFDAKELLAAGFDEMRRTLREREPARPSTRLSTMAHDELTATARHRSVDTPKLAKLLRGDLDWIVMKALEKDRTRRYETANGLVADIRRHLNNELIVARPPSAGYRMQKAIRRNTLAFTAAGAVFAALLVGIVVASWQAVLANHAATRAQQAEIIAREKSTEAEQESARAVASAATARDELENARAALAFIQDDLLGQASPDRQPDPDLTVRALLERASASFDKRTALPPKVEAAIRQTIGSVNFALGEYKAAIGHLERALVLQRQHLGAMHEDTLRTLHLLSDTHWWNGDDQKAFERAQEGWELSRRALGESHALSLTFLAGIAITRVYGESGTVDEIDRGIMEALRRVTESLGETDRLAFRLRVALAVRHLGRGKPLETELMLAPAIEKQRAILPESDPLMLEAVETLAKLFANQDKFDQADALNRRVLELRQRILGVNHALTVRVEIHQAWIYLKQGDLARVDRVHARLLDLLADGRLVESRFAVRSLVALLNLYRLQKLWGKVDELAGAVLAAGRNQFNEESLKVVNVHDEWGRGLMMQGRFAEAEPHFRSSVAVREKANDTHGRRHAAMSWLGWCLFGQNKDLALAEAYLKAGYDQAAPRWRYMPEFARLEILGGFMQRLADFYDGTGRPTEAAVFRRKLAELELSEGRPMLTDISAVF